MKQELNALETLLKDVESNDDTLKVWIRDNGEDPLVATVWGVKPGVVCFTRAEDKEMVYVATQHIVSFMLMGAE